MNPARPEKLTIELVPISSWGLNLSKQLPASKWKEIREESYAKARNVCEICGGRGTKHAVECHERWEFNPVEQTQTLIGLISLCPPCHSVKHFGRACAAGPEYREKAIAHLRKINGWSRKQVDSHIATSQKEWIDRCKIHWKVDTSLVGLQVDTGAARGEFLVTSCGDVPANLEEWTLLGDDYAFGVSFWKREGKLDRHEKVNRILGKISTASRRKRTAKTKPR